MELLDRYIQAVKGFLPRSQRDDIALEISDSLRSEMEDKETELGRPLNQDEESAILKAYGHPRLVASRYGHLQYLIGPTLLPFYLYTLRVVLVVEVVVQAITGWISATGSGDVVSTLAHFWLGLWSALFAAVGIVTVIFALLERFGRGPGHVDRWDPRSLPPLKDANWVPRPSSVVDLTLNAVFVMWVLGVVPVRQLVAHILLGPVLANVTAPPFTLTAWWQILVPALVVVALVNIAVDVINLLRPQLVRLRAGAIVLTSSLLFVVICVILRAYPYVVVTPGVAHPERYQPSADALSATLLATFIAWAIINGIIVVVNALRLHRQPQRLLAASGNS